MKLKYIQTFNTETKLFAFKCFSQYIKIILIRTKYIANGLKNLFVFCILERRLPFRCKKKMLKQESKRIIYKHMYVEIKMTLLVTLYKCIFSALVCMCGNATSFISLKLFRMVQSKRFSLSSNVLKDILCICIY